MHKSSSGRWRTARIRELHAANYFVDSFKTELIADRVWRSRSKLELAVAEHIGWFNDVRLHKRSTISHRQGSNG